MFSAIQECIQNQLPKLECGALLAGIIGDRPSEYAKSPSIWNPVMQQLEIPAFYASFDVDASDLASLVKALLNCSAYVGGNVTVPYKVSIIPFLDGLDEKAAQIGAVNTIARSPDGSLIGYNTDGKGALDTLVLKQPDRGEAFYSQLDGRTLVLLGAGGAARALAFYLAEAIGSQGKLYVANRTREKARELAREVSDVYGNTYEIDTEELSRVFPETALLINATVCGQTGIRSLPDGFVTYFEPYSPLATAEPETFLVDGQETEDDFYRRWLSLSRFDIERNNSQSLDVLSSLPTDAKVFDIIYAPLETTLLGQARRLGRATINGKGMNVAQAADGFFSRVFRIYLESHGLHNEATYNSVLGKMYEVW